MKNFLGRRLYSLSLLTERRSLPLGPNIICNIEEDENLYSSSFQFTLIYLFFTLSSSISSPLFPSIRLLIEQENIHKREINLATTYLYDFILRSAKWKEYKVKGTE